MKTFRHLFESHNWDDVLLSIYLKTETDALRALHSDRLDLEDFKTLLTPVARHFLGEMAQKSNQNTFKNQKDLTLLNLEGGFNQFSL